MARVTVQIEWPEGLEALPAGAQARVTVEDATTQDDAAAVLAETVVEDLDPRSAPVVELDVGEYDARADLVVRVHVAGPGAATRGIATDDLITTQSHPVLTHGHGDSVVVPLRAVGP